MASAADCLTSSRGGELRAAAPGEEKRAENKKGKGKARRRAPLVFCCLMPSVSFAVCEARARVYGSTAELE
eukprot:scaffold70332_cov59-Phaeocystis_antarctica.AAC.4